MRAAYVDQPGPAEAIRIGELPTPSRGSGEVLVAVEQVAVNPVDVLVRSGAYATPLPLPFVIGRDLIGTVAEVPDPALGFTPGQRVWSTSLGHDGRQGSFAEFATVSPDRLYPVPGAVDGELLLAAGHPGTTAYLGCFTRTWLRPGLTMLIGGAAGNVGQAATAMASAAGARVIATARRDQADDCRAAGAELVLDYRAADLAGQVRGAAPDGVDVVWDTSGRQPLAVTAEVIAPGGTVLLTAAGQARPELPLTELYTKDVDLRGFVVSRATSEQLAQAAELVAHLVATSALIPRITERGRLSDAAEVHRRMAAGEIRGRVLLDVAQ